MSRSDRFDDKPLRRGWTTGACATAALKSALVWALTGKALDPVSIQLPKGQEPSFVLAVESHCADTWTCGIIKDAGDDPDVTHGALVKVSLRKGEAGSGLVFKAGPGVGVVTRAGLPIPVGEASITPVPRSMMGAVVDALCSQHKVASDWEVEISIPGGEVLAEQTLNPRLGVVGGLSILGTTGIVTPYSCSSWIHSIHRGIDVARAAGLAHVAGSTGHQSETAIQRVYGFESAALLDMGDFAGGLLKYLRDHPIDRLSLTGGIGKFSKLAQGHMDLHSARSQVDQAWLADRVKDLGAAPAVCRAVAEAKSASEALGLVGDLPLAATIAELAKAKAEAVLGGAVNVEVWISNRAGQLIAQTKDCLKPLPNVG